MSTGAPVMDDPQETSKHLSRILKRDLVMEFELIWDAAWMIWDFLLITRMDVCTWGTWASSSAEELESESDDDDELSSFVLGGSVVACFVSATVKGFTSGFLERLDIWRHWRSSSVIGGDIKEGSGRGCLAPLACEVRGLHPEPISMRMSRWRKRLGQTSSRE